VPEVLLQREGRGGEKVKSTEWINPSNTFEGADFGVISYLVVT
jgi:hypothetical protein